MSENNKKIFNDFFIELDAQEEKIKQLSHGYSNIVYECQQTRNHIENKLSEQCSRDDMRVYYLALTCLKKQLSSIEISLQASDDLVTQLDKIEWPKTDAEDEEFDPNLTF